MLAKNKSRLPIANKLLAALSQTEYRRVMANLVPVELHADKTLYESGDTIKYVYFPNDALISMQTMVDQRHSLEVGIVGREGMIGIMVAMGISVAPIRAVVQCGGGAMRMNAAAFRKEFRLGQSMQREIHLFTRTLMIQMAQTSACNRFHSVEERLARRFLMTRDRLGSDHFSLTHEFLGDMLGIRRVGVTKAAYQLKQRKLIDYSRGNVAILNVRGLQASACSCYEVTHAKDIHGKA